jgi:peptidoglycan/xylan/chitin deacetylase (PgdA/CDA1 family)
MGTGVMRSVGFLACLVATAGCGRAQRKEQRLAPEVRTKATELAHEAEVESGEIVWRVQTDRKAVALTFDDGPDPKYTPTVLALGRQRGVKFTFFLVGREIQLHPDLARQEVAEGHMIGNHTWEHPTMTYDTERQDISEVERCEDEIEKICGERTHLFRPPKGMWDGDTFLAAEALGYRMILWSVALEHHEAKTPEAMAQRVLDQVQPGMIILAHDGEPCHQVDRSKTMKALPILLDGLKQRGYELVTIPELLKSRRER